jgi:hypothetical protein
MNNEVSYLYLIIWSSVDFKSDCSSELSSDSLSESSYEVWLEI